jgi:hypothetical protein
VHPSSHEGRHLGRDVYVLGSGPSLNHIPVRFWHSKVIVATNTGPLRLLPTVDYVVTKYHPLAAATLETHPEVGVVVTRHGRGQRSVGEFTDERAIIVDHNENPCGSFDGSQWPTDPHAMVATWSTIATAMHWAAYLGASNIILAGHDCGWIDDAGRIPGYQQETSGGTSDDDDSYLWAQFSAQSEIVKAQLVARYGVSVTSVNPFINLALEGHTYRRAG